MQKYMHNMQQICNKNAKNICKKKYAKKMHKICKNMHNMQKYMQQICNKYAKYAKQICNKYAKKYAKNIQHICNKYAQYAKKKCSTYAKKYATKHGTKYLQICTICKKCTKICKTNMQKNKYANQICKNIQQICTICKKNMQTSNLQKSYTKYATKYVKYAVNVNHFPTCKNLCKLCTRDFSDDGHGHAWYSEQRLCDLKEVPVQLSRMLRLRSRRLSLWGRCDITVERPKQALAWAGLAGLGTQCPPGGPGGHVSHGIHDSQAPRPWLPRAGAAGRAAMVQCPCPARDQSRPLPEAATAGTSRLVTVILTAGPGFPIP